APPVPAHSPAAAPHQWEGRPRPSPLPRQPPHSRLSCLESRFSPRAVRQTAARSPPHSTAPPLFCDIHSSAAHPAPPTPVPSIPSPPSSAQLASECRASASRVRICNRTVPLNFSAPPRMHPSPSPAENRTGPYPPPAAAQSEPASAPPSAPP